MPKPAVRRPSRLGVLAGVLSGSLILGACPGGGLTNPSTCGPENTAHLEISGDDLWRAPFPSESFRDGGGAVFTWDFEVTGICRESPERLNTASFLVLKKANTPALVPGTTRQGRVFHAFGFNPYTTVIDTAESSGNDIQFTGNLPNVGLEQASFLQEGALRVVLDVRIDFPSSGDFAADLASLKERVHAVSLSFRYLRAKE